MNVIDYLKKLKSTKIVIALIAVVMLCIGFFLGRIHQSAVVSLPKEQISTPVLQAEEGKIDLNSATQKELMSLPGIGEKTADAIISYREDVGGFLSVDELTAIKGLGEKKISAIKPYVTIGTKE